VDGWGIAFYEGKGCRVFLDTHPSASSPIARFVASYPIHSLNVVAHIRKATQGARRLKNTQPYSRELWGRYWIFAHNGSLENFDPPLKGTYTPVGDSDSEIAFCWILEHLKNHLDSMTAPLEDILVVLEDVTRRVWQYGTFNYLLSNGEYLFVHCSTSLYYLVRQAPFAEARLKDKDVAIDFHSVTQENDRVAVIATEPLTEEEPWIKIAPKTLLAFKEGIVVKHLNIDVCENAPS
jgi:predicted glutamine amidotransferase